MGVIIGDSLESYTYEEYKSDQYSSLWKIDEADNLLPPSEAQQETCKICCDDHSTLACASDLPLEFQDKRTCIIDLLQGQSIQT